MSCPGEEVHNSTPCRPHSKALLHRNDGNLRKLGRLLYPLFHISRTHADDGPKKSSPASGPGRVDLADNSMERNAASSGNGNSCRLNTSGKFCHKPETMNAAMIRNSYCNPSRGNETCHSSVSADKGHDLALVMELRALLDVEEEPFVLQESIQEKRRPVRSKSSRGLMKLTRAQPDPLADVVHGRRKSQESVEECHGLLASCEVSGKVCNGHESRSQRKARACVDGQIKSIDMMNDEMSKIRANETPIDESGESSPIPVNPLFREDEGRDYNGICHGLLDHSGKLDQSSLLQHSSPVSVLDTVCLEEEEDRSSDILSVDCCHSSSSEASNLIRSGSIQYDLESNCSCGSNNATHGSGSDGGIFKLMEKFKEGSRSQALMESNISLGQGNMHSLAYHDQIRSTKHLHWLHVPDEILQEVGRPAITSFITVLDAMVPPPVTDRRLGTHDSSGRDDGYSSIHEEVRMEVERCLFKMLLQELLGELVVHC